jgi:adenosylcobinamide hydrolase
VRFQLRLDLLQRALDEWALPHDQYAITTSGALAAHGIREANDLDLIVTPRLWDDLAAEHPNESGKIRLGEHVEILGPESLAAVGGRSQIARAIQIDGYPFVLLEDVRDVKVRLGRPKDLADLALIDAYLADSRDALWGRETADRKFARRVGVAGVSVRTLGGVLHIRSDRPLRALSSASCGGGLRIVQDVLNVHVSRFYRSETPEADLRAVARDHGIDGDFVGLLTAVHVEKAHIATRRDGRLVVACVATAGVGNATCAGRETPFRPDAQPPAGTINVVLVVEADLPPEALVNLVITATEAKTLALIESGITTASGDVATGTSTDTIVALCTGQGDRCRYAGPATLVGHLAAQCVHEAVTESLRAPEPAEPAASPFDAR